MRQREDERFQDYFGRSVRALSDYLGIGFQIAVSFAFFVLIGYWGDQQLGTTPLLMLLGVVVGMVGMILLLMKIVKQANKKRSGGTRD
ncbi:AtpZ/AtpI family protein [Prosthecochloris sp. N3]|uniref:AtpZ/AtpI family protein n=1 Tax=Prosthecochloris ethylica TaxID=2743976 RepID=A0ABR9XUL3_9CHLB|nr:MULTISPECIES: AtpZ/AtpI family protein [Prosthecochloris]MBF0587206.1 AtpZ/AtpI family protein [Prosthecochloris ethylica]MBF0637684.1 AtpZ/AtpI family protein [Prosthecochloris ethylica]NUK48334.1 AtpZ/AtpI family protein [Prosthecochloris ethylica]RNA65664.1 AtpZ/AtpI family protein [Prosthecochloris sp. ZM_2]